MMGSKRIFSPEETDFLREIAYGRTYAEMTEAFNARFGSSPVKKRLLEDVGRSRLGLPDRRMSVAPAGAERVEHGRVFIKTADGAWKKIMNVAWEDAHGNVPEGHHVIPADGNQRNTATDNLLLVSRKELFLMSYKGLLSTNPDRTRLGHALVKSWIAMTKYAKSLGLSRAERLKAYIKRKGRT